MESLREPPQKNHHVTHTVEINSKPNPESSTMTNLNTHILQPETNPSPPKSTFSPNLQKNPNSPTFTSISATCCKPENSLICSSAMQITSRAPISRIIAISPARNLQCLKPRGAAETNHRKTVNSSQGISHPPWE